MIMRNQEIRNRLQIKIPKRIRLVQIPKRIRVVLVYRVHMSDWRIVVTRVIYLMVGSIRMIDEGGLSLMIRMMR